MTIRNAVLTTLLTVVTASFLPITAQAQNVNHRLRDQNQRINQGVKNGELTRNQVDRLKSRDASVRARELRDKANNNGHLTSQERKNLNRSLNRDSKAIYRDKHDAAAHGH